MFFHVFVEVIAFIVEVVVFFCCCCCSLCFVQMRPYVFYSMHKLFQFFLADCPTELRPTLNLCGLQRLLRNCHASQQIVLDYFLSSEKGEILKRNGEELKKLKIGEKTYNFERGKPISKILNTKFNKIRQTMDYKKYELKEKKGIRWVNLDKNKALTGIQMRYKATTTNAQSAFKGYVNSFAITNVRVRGIKALQYLKYQDLRLKEYLMKHKGMKVILQVSATMKSKKTNEEIRESIRSRRYNITNEDEIPQKLNQMATDIEFQLDKMEMSESGLVLKITHP